MGLCPTCTRPIEGHLGRLAQSKVTPIISSSFWVDTGGKGKWRSTAERQCCRFYAPATHKIKTSIPDLGPLEATSTTNAYNNNTPTAEPTRITVHNHSSRQRHASPLLHPQPTHQHPTLTSKPSSRAMMSSTVSSESAPKSCVKDAVGTTWLSSTASCDTTMLRTLDRISGSISPSPAMNSGARTRGRAAAVAAQLRRCAVKPLDMDRQFPDGATATNAVLEDKRQIEAQRAAGQQASRKKGDQNLKGTTARFCVYQLMKAEVKVVCENAASHLELAAVGMGPKRLRVTLNVLWTTYNLFLLPFLLANWPSRQVRQA